MIFTPNRQYLIRNIATSAGTYMDLYEVIPYNGHQVLYGYLRTYPVRIGAGAKAGQLEYEGRPVAFPRPNYERDRDAGMKAIVALMRVTGGDDGTGRPFGQLRISEHPPGAIYDAKAVKWRTPGSVEEEPIFNAGKECMEMWRATWYQEGWTGHTPNRDGLVRGCEKLLNLYDEYVRTGKLAISFRHEYREWRNKQQMKGLMN